MPQYPPNSASEVVTLKRRVAELERLVRAYATHSHHFRDLTDGDLWDVANGEVPTYNSAVGTFQPGSTSGVTPASSVVSETAFGQAAAVGTALPYARQDHTHGTPAAPVTSFNTRTGAVVLAHGDVTAALGFTPLNRAGDTMTGPLVVESVIVAKTAAGGFRLFDRAAGLESVEWYSPVRDAMHLYAYAAGVDRFTISAAGVVNAPVQLQRGGVNVVTTDDARLVNVASFNTRTGAVTLTSGDMTTALGFTPANKSGDTITGPWIVESVAVVKGGSGGYRFHDRSTNAESVEWYSPAVGALNLYSYGSGSDRLTLSAGGVLNAVVGLQRAGVNVVTTDDSRLSDARTPTGAAGGVLSGTYPSPTLAADRVRIAGDTMTGALAIASNTAQLRVGAASTTNEGGWLASFAAHQAMLSGGVAFELGNGWRAKATTASMVVLDSGWVIFRGNSGLTAGNLFTPTNRFSIDPTGVVTVGDVSAYPRTTLSTTTITLADDASNIGSIAMEPAVSGGPGRGLTIWDVAGNKTILKACFASAFVDVGPALTQASAPAGGKRVSLGVTGTGAAADLHQLNFWWSDSGSTPAKVETYEDADERRVTLRAGAPSGHSDPGGITIRSAGNLRSWPTMKIWPDLESVAFGSVLGQLINLYSNTYGVGIQTNCAYMRTNSRFSVFQAGAHSNTENAPGTGGAVLFTANGNEAILYAGNADVAELVGQGFANCRTVNPAASAYREHQASTHSNLSDVSTKRNVRPIAAGECSSKIAATRPFRFRWRAGWGDGGAAERVGLDAAAVPAEVVAPMALASDPTLKGIDSAAAIALLWGAVAEILDRLPPTP